VFLTYLIYLIL